MAGLRWEIDGDVLYDEARYHVHDSLYHLQFFRDFIRRTGLLENAERVGWSWGDPSYMGFGDLWEVETDQLNRMLAIMELPVESAWMNDTSHVVEGLAQLLDPETGEEMEVGEEDLVVTFDGESQEDLDRLVRLVASLKPPAPFPMVVCRYVEMEHERGTLIAQYARKEAEKKPSAALLIPNMEMDPFAVYHGLFPQIIRAWEVMRDGEPEEVRA